MAVAVSGEPRGFQMDFAGGFTFVLDFEPFIEATMDSKRRQLNAAFSDGLVAANFIVPNVEVEIVAEIVDLDVEVVVVPLWVLTSIFADGRLELLLTASELDIGVHLANRLNVVGKVSLHEGDLHNSFVCHKRYFN